MKIPFELEERIEKEVENIKLSDLKDVAKNLSNRYMNEKRSGQSLLSEDIEAIVYSIIRMPATYSAVKIAALEANCNERKIDSILDVGAGTGAASFAICEIIDIKVERIKEKFMNISIIGVGKIKEKYLKLGIDEFSKRLTKYCKLDIIELDDEKCPENLSEKDMLIVKDKEGKKILSKVKNNSYVIALAIDGKNLSSEELADTISKLAVRGNSHITFVIGGSLGLSDEVLKRADYKLSFSKMTFPHQLMRLILLEQVYRAFRINNNEPYHK